MLESVLIAIDGRQDLVQAILNSIKQIKKDPIVIDTVNSQKFSDGELCVDFTNSIRGKRVYLLTSPNNSDEIIKLNLAIDAAKRAAAKEIIPILPFFPYQRSDKKDQSRGPIGAKVMVEMIENRGATGVITFDLHADQIQGFFNIPVTHLEGKNVFDNYIASIYNENTILCGPDAGSGKRVKRMKDQLAKYHDISINYVMLDKTRKQANVIDEMIIIGDVTGKDVIILDDMVDTAGTLCKAAEVVMEAGANSVRAIISHGVLSGPALGRIEKSVLTELVISDSLDKGTGPIGFGMSKIKSISVATQIGYAVVAINSQSSYEGLKKARF
jgi:ribose-phosphate pyrophosphokinase